MKDAKQYLRDVSQSDGIRSSVGFGSMRIKLCSKGKRQARRRPSVWLGEQEDLTFCFGLLSEIVDDGSV